MESWLVFALLSMIFAGVTAIFAKYGLERLDADLGLLIRTTVIFLLVIITALWTKVYKDIPSLTKKEIVLLVASGVTAFLSWLFYFRALKDGPVTYVATIDKASLLITLILAFVLFKEPLKPQVLIGAGLVFAGMLVLTWK
jgi:bacterial/archaeal transporter family protein